jgi:hypothetical protein
MPVSPASIKAAGYRTNLIFDQSERTPGRLFARREHCDQNAVPRAMRKGRLWQLAGSKLDTALIGRSAFFKVTDGLLAGQFGES